jgi:hypothetical protein
VMGGCHVVCQPFGLYFISFSTFFFSGGRCLAAMEYVVKVLLSECFSQKIKSAVCLNVSLGAAVLTAAALTVYGGFGANVHRWTAATNGPALSTSPRLYWAYFVGVAGTVSALVTGSLFFCDGRSRRRHLRHIGYRKTIVV